MKTYTIKEISQMFHFPPSTLRYYEEAGLLTDIERTVSGQRIYTDKHVNRLKTICCFKNAGMTISQLKEFFYYEAREADCIDDILLLSSSVRRTEGICVSPNYAITERLCTCMQETPLLHRY